MAMSMKADRFKRVAAPRVQRVLDSIDNLSKCSNRRNYEYTSEDVRRMLTAIKRRVRTLEQLFDNEDGGLKKDVFSF
jgi:hypothetical protein